MNNKHFCRSWPQMCSCQLWNMKTCSGKLRIWFIFKGLSGDRCELCTGVAWKWLSAGHLENGSKNKFHVVTLIDHHGRWPETWNKTTNFKLLIPKVTPSQQCLSQVIKCWWRWDTVNGLLAAQGGNNLKTFFGQTHQDSDSIQMNQPPYWILRVL